MSYLDPEFSTLPAGWSARPLREIVEIHNTKRVPLNGRDRERRQGSYPYCGANGIVDHIDDFRFDGEYVLIAEDGGHWGKQESSSYIMRGKFWVNNHAHAVRAIPDVTTNEFLSFMVNYLNIQPFIGGDARGKLTKAILEQLGIPLPPLPEQKKIAHILSTVQRAIEEQERIIQTTTELKKALMQKLFTEGLRNEPQKQTEIGPVPKSWEVVKLSSVCSFQSGGTPSKQNPEFWEGTIPWVSPKDMKRPRLTDVKDHISQEALESGSKLAPAGSVLVVVRGMILAKTVPVALAEVPMAINQDMKAIVPGTKLRSDFLLYALETLRGALFKKVGRAGHGTATLMSSEIANFKIPLPDLKTQEEVATSIHNLERKNELHQRKLADFQDLFRVLLHELMTAKLNSQ
jgi:type I restriction enzyme, S subunit